MTRLELARWQFGITTVYHFLFVPLTIGLGFLLAIFQTAAHRTGNDVYRRMTSFFGKLFLINFGLGVVTGIVQEFQFGMNWSQYSRYVGDVFGPPLAMEGLMAFFLESTFLGLWIFGRERLSPRLHLATIWIVSIGSILSALMILAANSWMQHPVGFRINPATGRATLTNFWAVLTNQILIVTFWHTILAAIATGAFFVIGISAFHLLRHNEVELFRKAAGIAMVVAFVASLGVAFVGHMQAQVMTKIQPMKMAAAEALYDTETGASFSLLTIGNLSGQPIFQIRLPHLLSVLATNSWNGKVEGINDIQAQERAQFGPGSYTPVIWVTYWGFRTMVGAGFAMIGLSSLGLYLMRRRRLERSRRFLWVLVPALALPYIANSAGWIFTEMGRQPWVIYGLMKTTTAVSPTVGTADVTATLLGFTLLYGVLAAIDFWLMARIGRAGPSAQDDEHEAGQAEPALVY
ncbi:MAG TPA: cytochrome ubiquinol oxidase subunit I [Actinomycetota bacterium]|nr:cytochrome ubiquinol oxidase subunit I [Actinomycetota bacterium]